MWRLRVTDWNPIMAGLRGEHRTTLVIAHRLSTIRTVNQIVVLDKGAVAEVGSHTELSQRKGGIFAAMWATQVEGSAAPATALEAVAAVEVDAEMVHDAMVKHT
jgi:ABC-type multidrug transport system ATPase subunit